MALVHGGRTVSKVARDLGMTTWSLTRVPAPQRSDQVWVDDITYLDTGEGWLYPAGLPDACSRRCVG